MQPPNNLQQFQLAFGRHLRNPKQTTCPKGIPPRRSNVYESLLFNNVCGFIGNCFPVTQQTISEKRWKTLCRAFFRDWRATDPIFSGVPYEFLSYVCSESCSQPLPPWFAELLHYEWIELYVDTMQVTATSSELPPTQAEGTHTNNFIYTNETLHVLNYEWPVHQISANYKPRKKRAYFCLVYRTKDDDVQFTETNAITALLMQTLQESPQPAEQLLQTLAEQLQWPDKNVFFEFGRKILHDLNDKEAIYFNA